MRRPDWDTRLARWATLRNLEPFVWGQTDCAMLCLEAFDVMTGLALAEEHRGRYHSQSSALRYQRQHGIDVDVALYRAGCVQVVPGLQQRGDFVIVEREPFPHGHVSFGVKALSSTRRDFVRWGTINFSVSEGMHILRVP